MARWRNRESDITTALAQLAVLVVAAAIFIPQFRDILFGFGVIVFALAILVGVVGLGILIFRPSDRQADRPSQASIAFNALTLPVPIVAPLNVPLTTNQLIERLRVIDWFQFEKIVDMVYRKHGYASIRRGGANPDGGIDLIIEKDGQRKAVQCKQWKTWKVGVKPVREFLGALKDAEIEHGILVTLGGYTGDAKLLADKHHIAMLNETELARMLEAVNARLNPGILELLNDDRKFCPKCEREMVMRTAGKGRGAGQQFWGCSAYPRCRFTLRI